MAIAKTRTEELRKDICAAASALFIRRGFGATTMQDIAIAMGISRPKLYYYFPDKSSILKALVSNVTVEAHRRAEAVAESEALDGTGKLRELIKTHADLILARRLDFRVLDMSVDHLPRSMRTRARKAQRGLLEAFTKVIREGIDAGFLRPTDARVAAFATIGMCNWTSAWYQPGGRLSAEQICEILADLGVAALAVQIGSRKMNGVVRSLRMLREGVAGIEAVLGRMG